MAPKAPKGELTNAKRRFSV